jgi:choline dehydrogenase-like flavoprotein
MKYDYIIVGAGAAGTVIAARLTTELKNVDEKPVNILLVEAGKENRSKDMDKTMAAPNPMELWGDKSLTFNDCMVARSAQQPSRAYPVGRCIGGGSAINGM